MVAFNNHHHVDISRGNKPRLGRPLINDPDSIIKIIIAAVVLDNIIAVRPGATVTAHHRACIKAAVGRKKRR